MKKGNLSFALLFWLNRQRCKNDKPAIYLRLTVDNKRIELATRQYVDPKLWNQEAQCVKGSTEEAKTINRQLVMMKAELHKHYSYLLGLDKPVDAESLKNQYMGIGEKQRTLCEAFDLHNKRFAEKVQVSKKSASTLKRLEITKQKVIAFIKYQYKVSDKPLDTIRFSFAADFEHYLSTIQKIGSNTSMKYIKNVKQVLKMAADQGWIPVNPLSGFKCSYNEPQRERLTMDEIMQLYNKDL